MANNLVSSITSLLLVECKLKMEIKKTKKKTVQTLKNIMQSNQVFENQYICAFIGSKSVPCAVGWSNSLDSR